MSEPNAVKYQRLPENKLSPRITSSVGIRNIIKTSDDVHRLWGCQLETIKLLGLDLGQVSVVGASALLPSHGSFIGIAVRPKFYNLAIKQKTVHTESSLLPLCGNAASIKEYIDKLVGAETHLSSFYKGRAIKRHRWNAKRARDEEYVQIANRLLNMVGGSVGVKRKESDKVVIARKTFMHRAVMAGHNIANVVRGHLIHQQQPLYLQPIDKKELSTSMDERQLFSTRQTSSTIRG
ncbi:hypothetical protein BCR41DRAFT_394554 [Lobosporangium transversale]|uniref:Uncharacterized protein n=1 Tax=Lobosporangium transversale TaxID=64571 RepID=A0A1Y2GSL5_9FUNG|nr:hypothetical protein BCR41DRAFT_394554 [Lobosporangium transversale]ORZ21782.1 hypothetical protein BCR41DRAFT_394554 [Lobosporangium transversale]|eukprot:XP_021883033.1 hypothetical protein BCR41DRAFT_394554 [Lobosporangium transversale]